MNGFLDKLFGKLKPNPAYTGTTKKKKNSSFKEEYLFEPESIDGKIIIGNKTPSILGDLAIGKNKYLISKLKLSFDQKIDRNKLPASLTEMGMISLTIIGKTDDLIDDWVLNTKKMYSGDLRFFHNDIKKIGQSLVNITFENAYCVEYRTTINVCENLNETTILLYPETLKIANEEF